MGTRRIPLSRGQVAIIDEADFELVGHHRWSAKPTKRGSTFYAQRTVSRNGKNTTVYMHRVIANAPTGMVVDHRDGNGLNNTRANLRVGTQAQNMANASLRPNNTSGYIGVTWDRAQEKWVAQIQVGGKCIRIGRFATKEEAAKARAEYANRIHGEWASRHEVHR